MPQTPGTAVPAGDPASLAAVLRSWLTEPTLRRSWRQAALARRDTLPGWQQTAEAVLAYLDRRPNVTVDPGWLAARAAADTSARAATVGTLLPELINYLIETVGRRDVLEIIDLGAGTGANQRWLAPRLPFQTALDPS